MNHYLTSRTLVQRQYRPERRATVTGAVAVHTAESKTDVLPPDTGAESVAKFMTRRTDYGSYHSIVDSDSIVKLVPYESEAFHDGTGGNRFSLGISLAMQAHHWDTVPSWWVEGAIRNLAVEASAMSDWIQEQRGFRIPARRITSAQYRDGEAGFVTHAELDPRRRSDPGAGFPWVKFFAYYGQIENQKINPTPAPTPAEETEEAEVLLTQAVKEAHLIYDALGFEDEKGKAFWIKRLAEIVYGGFRYPGQEDKTAEEAIASQLQWLYNELVSQ